jgi:hypothetical protein
MIGQLLKPVTRALFGVEPYIDYFDYHVYNNDWDFFRYYDWHEKWEPESLITTGEKL